MNLWVLAARALPWVLGAACLLVAGGDVCRATNLWQKPVNRRDAYLGLALVLLGGLLSATRLGWQVFWALLAVAFAGYLAWNWSGRVPRPTVETSEMSASAMMRSGSSKVLVGLNWAETAIVAVAAPVLWFPSLRPQLTILALLTLLLIWITIYLARGGLWPRSCYDPALLCLLIMAATGTLRSDIPVLTLPKAAGLILGVAIYRLILRLVRSRRSAMVVLYLALALGLLFALVGLVNGLRPSKVSWLGEQLARLPRWVQALPGTENGLVSMNQLGGALLYILPVVGGVVLSPAAKRVGDWPLKWLERGLLWVLATLLVLALVLTQSRAAWLGLASALFLIVILRWPWGRWAAIALLAGGLIWAWFNRGGVAAWLGLVLEQRAVETAIGSLSLTGRVSIWERAIACVRASPLLGCGLGAFRTLDADVAAAISPFDVGTPHAHQVFLQAATDLGLPGLIAYLAMLISAWRQSWQLYRRSLGVQRGMAIGFLATLLGSHIYGLADVVALGSKPGVLWWILLALIAAVSDFGDCERSCVAVGRERNARNRVIIPE